MTKPKTQAQLDRAADLRLRKTYGLSLDEYNMMEADGGCWICGSKPVGRRLHVDHDHGWKKIKIVSKNYLDCWQAIAVYNGREFYSTARTKSEVVRDVKQQLKRNSVRGLLCYPHNAGLQKFQDNRDLMRNAANYLDKFFTFGSPLSGQKESV